MKKVLLIVKCPPEEPKLSGEESLKMDNVLKCFWDKFGYDRSDSSGFSIRTQSSSGLNSNTNMS